MVPAALRLPPEIKKWKKTIFEKRSIPCYDVPDYAECTDKIQQCYDRLHHGHNRAFQGHTHLCRYKLGIARFEYIPKKTTIQLELKNVYVFYIFSLASSCNSWEDKIFIFTLPQSHR